MAEILITKAMPPAVEERARARYDVTIRDSTDGLTVDEAAEALSRYDGIVPTIGDRYTAEAFEKAGRDPRAKVLANFAVGYNHIDVEAARAHGVIVTNTPGAVTDATADIAVTLILMTCRRAAEGERVMRAGEWIGWQPTQYLGFHVTGKTLGIVGMGRIGKAIAARCHNGFGMDVVFHDAFPVSDAGVPARQLGSVREVLETADIVCISVPAMPETHHLIGAEELKALGPTSYLVNTSRGDVVDETALVAALTDGTIAGAGLDVYENEPKLTPGLVECQNAVLLPHLGTATLEVRTNMGMMALDNLDAVMDGREPPNPV